jgi:hypothetical protein
LHVYEIVTSDTGEKKLIGTVHLDIAGYAPRLSTTESKNTFDEVFKLESCSQDQQATLNVTLTFDQPKMHQHKQHE